MADNGIDLESLMQDDATFAPLSLRRGEIRNAIILEIREREIIVDLNAKQDGIVKSEDLERLDQVDQRAVADRVEPERGGQRDLAAAPSGQVGDHGSAIGRETILSPLPRIGKALRKPALALRDPAL